MKFLFRFALKIFLNAVALYALHLYLSGFILEMGLMPLVIGGMFLAFIATFIRPVIRLVTAPLVWLTLGLFNIIINIGLLWIADQILPQLEIAGFKPLFIASIILGLINSLV